MAPAKNDGKRSGRRSCGRQTFAKKCLYVWTVQIVENDGTNDYADNAAKVSRSDRDCVEHNRYDR